MFEIEEPIEPIEPIEPVVEPIEPVVPESGLEPPREPVEPAEAPVEGENTPNALEGDPETFPREYVVKLRKEAATFRERAKRTDDLAARLHTALVDATGKLADSRDLPFDEAHLSDPEALQQAIQSLLTERPHLASRKPMGHIGQGATNEPEAFGLGGLLRAHAN